MTNNNIDLHTHSSASDGTLTPLQLAKYACEKGLSSVALTDHDTVDGYDEFSKACSSLGVEAIPGIEISAKYKCEMHIIGLFINTKNPILTDKLYQLKNARLIRNRKMLDVLKQNNMPLTEADIISHTDTGSLASAGRPHIALAMSEYGYVSDINEAFEKYLGYGKSCYVKRLTFSPEESIKLIKDAGGIAILAHPIYITQNENELSELLINLKSFGLDGMECYYHSYTESFQKSCLNICESLGLLVSGGSDFHGSNRCEVDLGSVSVPSEVIGKMKKHIKN